MIELPIPDYNDRLDIVKGCLEGVPNDVDESTLKAVVERCHGRTGAFIATACREAVFIGLRKDIATAKVDASSLEAAFY